MKGIFVTGTNTEVGKTVISRALARALVNRGVNVGVAKPVESGAPLLEGRLVPPDTKALMKAAQYSKEEPFICSYCFEDAVSPHLAANREGVTIEARPLLSLIEEQLKSRDMVIAEGAGGLLVPLSNELLYADVVAKTGLGLLIVSPNVLGTINATLLTIEAARERNIPVLGVVLNRTPIMDFGNAAAISLHGQVPILGEFPDAPKLEDDDFLATLAEKYLDLDRLQ